MNDGLLNLKYSDVKTLRFLLKSYYKLESAVEKGNANAIAIKADIDYMLNENNNITKKDNIEAIKKVYLEDLAQTEVADIFGVAQETISYRITQGIKQIAEYWEVLDV